MTTPDPTKYRKRAKAQDRMHRAGNYSERAQAQQDMHRIDEDSPSQNAQHVRDDD